LAGDAVRRAAGRTGVVLRAGAVRRATVGNSFGRGGRILGGGKANARSASEADARDAAKARHTNFDPVDAHPNDAHPMTVP